MKKIQINLHTKAHQLPFPLSKHIELSTTRTIIIKNVGFFGFFVLFLFCSSVEKKVNIGRGHNVTLVVDYMYACIWSYQTNKFHENREIMLLHCMHESGQKMSPFQEIWNFWIKNRKTKCRTNSKLSRGPSTSMWQCSEMNIGQKL